MSENVSLDRARAAKVAALRMFSSCENLVGVGITRVRDDYAVKVNLSQPLPPGTELPSLINGVPVRFEVTGIPRVALAR